MRAARPDVSFLANAMRSAWAAASFFSAARSPP